MSRTWGLGAGFESEVLGWGFVSLEGLGFGLRVWGLEFGA